MVKLSNPLSSHNLEFPDAWRVTWQTSAHTCMHVCAHTRVGACAACVTSTSFYNARSESAHPLPGWGYCRTSILSMIASLTKAVLAGRPFNHCSQQSRLWGVSWSTAHQRLWGCGEAGETIDVPLC